MANFDDKNKKQKNKKVTDICFVGYHNNCCLLIANNGTIYNFKCD